MLLVLCAAVITIGFIVTALTKVRRAEFARLQDEIKELSEQVKALEVAEQRRFLKELKSHSEGVRTITFHECTIAEVRNGARGHSSACSVTWKWAHLQSRPDTLISSISPARRFEIQHDYRAVSARLPNRGLTKSFC